ncbi:hypothetical protein BESB_014040 [Besnoitia besnoiti]|uniref:PH domain-containing protein n=1 Tax=Besnoitia besnoiti TaxID=94643 RepID=A0A2A9MBM5_BESBE|nr:hypothetical protein BESB_014040 [Besnoitia besnoiti]PFH32792.1 hypothetical protein BESB_014040 [Besnoitia besnoiti]
MGHGTLPTPCEGYRSPSNYSSSRRVSEVHASCSLVPESSAHAPLHPPLPLPAEVADGLSVESSACDESASRPAPGGEANGEDFRDVYAPAKADEPAESLPAEGVDAPNGSDPPPCPSCTYTRPRRLSSAEQLSELLPAETPKSPSYYREIQLHPLSPRASPSASACVSSADALLSVSFASAPSRVSVDALRASPAASLTPLGQRLDPAGEMHERSTAAFGARNCVLRPPAHLSRGVLKADEHAEQTDARRPPPGVEHPADDEGHEASERRRNEREGHGRGAAPRPLSPSRVATLVSPAAATACSPTPSGAGPREEGTDSQIQTQTGWREQAPPLFREEYLHTAPARFDDEEVVLRKAERVIMQQRSRLEQLSSLLLRSENEKVAAHRAAQEEIGRYVEENRKLRLHLDAANGEVAAMGTVTAKHEKMLDQLTTTLAAAEKGISDRDRLLVLAQERDKTTENEHLKEEIQQMRCKIEKLTRGTAGSLADASSSGPRSANDVADQLAKVQREIDRHRAMGRQLGNTTQELRVSRMSLMQSQSHLLESQKLVEEQRVEIQRLYKVIEALNREKSLVPPVVVAPANALAVRRTQEQLDSLSTQVQMILARTEQAGSVADKSKSRGSSAVSLRMFEEQKTLLAKVLEALEQLASTRLAEEKSKRWDLEKNVFFAAMVLHAQTEEPEDFPLYRERLVAVKAATLAIFEDPADEEPLVVLRSHKVLNVRQDTDDLVFEIEYEVQQGIVEYHYLRCEEDEDMEKWLYALLYAGVMKKNLVDGVGGPAHAEVVDTENTVTYIAPSGKAPGGKDIPFAQQHAVLEYDAELNMITCEVKDNPDARLRIPCSNVTYCEDPEKLAFSFRVEPEGKDVYIIQAREDNFDHIAEVIQQGDYCKAPKVPASPSKKAVTEKRAGPGAPKKKAAPPAAKPKGAPPPEEENEQFIVRDGYLMLFQAGEKTPLLKLFHQDCITIPNDSEREFVIRHMPGTPDEETYVFGFLTDEIYKGWYQKLKDNGFLDRKEDGSVQMNQVGVVSKNVLELYRYYGTPGAKPVLEMRADRCKATASRERREILIIHTTPSGKRERITLDCATVAEFDRWNVALEFGGFLQGQGDANPKRNFANLSKYVFPVNLFEDDTGERRMALVIKSRVIQLFPSPDAQEPIMSIPADIAQVQNFIAQRKLRIYVNRDTDREERVDFILSLAKDYDRYASELSRQQFPVAADKSRGGSRKPFILSKKSLLALYKNKYQKSPEFVIEKDMYEADISSRVIIFKPSSSVPAAKVGNYPVRTVSVPSDEQMTKWDFCLRLVGFRAFSEKPPPKFFFPQIIYGFVAEEGAELRTGANFFRGFLGAGARGNPLQAGMKRLRLRRAWSRARQHDGAVSEVPLSMHAGLEVLISAEALHNFFVAVLVFSLLSRVLLQFDDVSSANAV